MKGGGSYSHPARGTTVRPSHNSVLRSPERDLCHLSGNSFFSLQGHNTFAIVFCVRRAISQLAYIQTQTWIQELIQFARYYPTEMVGGG
jgi:hypothetical protein